MFTDNRYLIDTVYIYIKIAIIESKEVISVIIVMLIMIIVISILTKLETLNSQAKHQKAKTRRQN